jgi:hypothetical protein
MRQLRALGWKTAARVAAWAGMAALLVLGCDWFEEQALGNIPPATTILECPGSEVLEGDDLLFRWAGTDADGLVVAYEWSLNGAAWIRTSEDSVLVESVGEGDQSFTVRAVDDRGVVDPAPPTCDFTAAARGELVDRVVLVEVFVTHHCPYCPNCQAALNAIYSELGRDSLCVVAYHDWREGDPASDPLGTEETVERIDWYTDDPGFQGRPDVWPTAVFDGLRVVEGAVTSEAAGADYLFEIRSREAVSSPVEMAVSGVLGEESGDIIVDVMARGRVPEGDLVLRMVVVEDGIYQWGKTHDFVVRDILDDEPVMIKTVGDSVRVEREFQVDASWNRERLDIIAFVQNDVNKEILQSGRVGE